MRLFLLISFMVLFSSPCFAEDSELPVLHTTPAVATPDIIIIDEKTSRSEVKVKSVICPFCQVDIWKGEEHKPGCYLEEPNEPKKKSLLSKAKCKLKNLGKKSCHKVKNSCKAVGKKSYELAKKTSKIVEPIEPLVRVSALCCVSAAQIAILFL